MKLVRATILATVLAAPLFFACSGPDQIDPAPGTPPSDEPARSTEPTVATNPVPTTAEPPETTPATVLDQGASDSPTATASIETSLAAPTEGPTTKAPTELPAPAATSPRPPTSTPVPMQPLSPWYVDPELAMLELLDQAGQSTNTNNQWTSFLLEEAHTVRRMYHVSRAGVGYFNDDTSDFLDWLGWFMSAGHEDPALRTHVYTQIRTAIYSPLTNIGRRIRQIEAGEDPRFEGSGPEVYWDYLIGPTNNRFWSSRLGLPGIEHEFESHMSEYKRIIIADSTAFIDFGAYLVSIGYDMGGKLAID